MQKPTKRFISCLTGDWADHDRVVQPDYWSDQLRGTVHFYQGIVTASQAGSLYLEVGPGQALSTLVHGLKEPRHPLIKAVSSLPHPKQRMPARRHLLNAMATLWEQGVYVDWHVLHGERAPRRIAMPGYVFDHTDYWLEDRPYGGGAAAADGGFYVRTWLRTPWPFSGASRKPGHIALFLPPDAADCKDALIRSLNARGHGVTSISVGPSFIKDGPGTFRIAFDQPSQWNDLFDHLAQENRWPAILLDASHLGNHEMLSPDQALNGLKICLAAIQERTDEPSPTMCSLTVRQFQVTGMESLAEDAGTLASALASLAAGCPSFRLIDLDSTESPETWSDHVVEDLLTPETTIAYRGGFRWCGSWTALPHHASHDLGDKPARCAIIGGLPRQQALWTRVLADLGAEEVTWFTAQESDLPEAVQTWIEAQGLAVNQIVTGELNRDFLVGPFRQDLAADGDIDLLVAIPDADTDSIWPTTWTIADLIGAMDDLPIRSIIADLPLTAVTGMPGQAGPGALAGRWLADAERIARQGPIPVTAIIWDRFRLSGQAAKTSLEQTLATAVRLGLTGKESHLIALDTAPDTIRQRYREGIEAVPPSTAGKRPSLSTPYEAPRDEIEATVATCWQDLLGIDRVGIHDEFFELGGHSLLATRIMTQLEDTFGVPLPVETLFSAPTVADLAEAIVIALANETDDAELEALLAEVEEETEGDPVAAS